MFNITDQRELVSEIMDIDSKIQEELESENVNKKKIYELRFQQLMKGIQITQNPYYF